AVPAEGPLAHALLERRDGLPDVLALGRARQLVVLDPAPAVAAHVETGLADRRRGRRMPLERQRAAEDRQRQAALEEQAHQAPESDAAAVLEHSLGGEVTALHALAQRVGLGEPRLRI